MGASDKLIMDKDTVHFQAANVMWNYCIYSNKTLSAVTMCTTFVNRQDVGIADQQKAQKQGRDDSINSSVCNPPYISLMWKNWATLFYAIIPTLFLCFLLLLLHF